MIRKLFGTDGIRAHINDASLQPESISRLGRILSTMLLKQEMPLKKAAIVIGRDTRASGSSLEKALIDGIIHTGVDCILLGVVPTAAVAFYTKKMGAGFGVMISASHNPYHDNGLKLFDSCGFKITDDVEELIESEYFFEQQKILPPVLKTGSIIRHDDGAKEYCAMVTNNHLRTSVRKKIVVDAAHGAASFVAQKIFSELFADVTFIGTSPDGNNINRGFGSEAPDRIKNEVKQRNADLGIAFDGDADRVIFVDERGKIIDGDAILATVAIDLKMQNRLKNNAVVATVMSSVALDKTLLPHGITVVRTQVGDKLVARSMLENDINFGGENSGHLIHFPKSSTGDGIVSALAFLDILGRKEIAASDVVKFYEPTPKLLTNVDVAKKIPLEMLPNTQALIARANENFNNVGRVMLRYSGTENKVRLLVEAPTDHECIRITDRIMSEFYAESASIAAT